MDTRRARWVWRAHVGWLLVLAVGWAVSFVRLEQSKPDASGARGGEVALQVMAGIGHGVATAAVMVMGLVVLAYALLSSLVLALLKGRALAAVAIHTLTVGGVLSVSALDAELDRRRREREQVEQAEQELRRAEELRAAHECLRVERLVLHPGAPLRADVHLAASCAATLTGITLEGDGPGGERTWIFDNSLRRPVTTTTATISLGDDDALEDTQGWVWTVELDFETDRASLLNRLFCGPGATSDVPEFKPCFPLPRVEP